LLFTVAEAGKMKTIRRYAMRCTILGILTIAGVFGISLWNKADFCSGWATQYEQRAVDLRNEQLLAIAEKRLNDANAFENSALTMSVIAKKYNRVANNPLLAYPSKPLVTDAELNAERIATDN
tara:strand:+ start:495 stop:863 length:369 start_codon:yes stop_codon:yes gene_type:complete